MVKPHFVVKRKTKAKKGNGVVQIVSTNLQVNTIISLNLLSVFTNAYHIKFQRNDRNNKTDASLLEEVLSVFCCQENLTQFPEFCVMSVEQNGLC